MLFGDDDKYMDFIDTMQGKIDHMFLKYEYFYREYLPVYIFYTKNNAISKWFRKIKQLTGMSTFQNSKQNEYKNYYN